MKPVTFIVTYCTFIVLGSLLGGVLPSWIRLTHTRMQIMVSFVGGLMLGVGLLHLLPHSLMYLTNIDDAVLWMIVGLLSMFFLIRVFDFHQHGVAEDSQSHERDHDHHAGHSHQHRLSWVGVAIGLAIHTLIDGVALGAAVVAEPDALLPGFSIFLVILLHKPLDALSITSLMAAGGWSIRGRQIVNFAFALMCPLGAIGVAGGVDISNGVVDVDQQQWIGVALAFSAGVFLCISLGDLLPEVHFHHHDRLKLSAALLAGILVSYTIGFLEHQGHRHNHQHAPQDEREHRH